MAGYCSSILSEIPSLLRSCIIENVQLAGSQISKGINSTVLEGKWEGTVVAVKQVHFSYLSEQEQEITRSKFLIECDRSNRMRHSNVVRFLGIVYLSSQATIPSVVMERLHCTLNSLLEQNSLRVPLEVKTSILHQIGLGLRYLHSRVPAVVRGNLTSKNILISKGMEAKIADLGTIRFFDLVRAIGASANQDFMAPEILVNNPNIKYGKESDIFSFGCIMLHTFSHQWPKPLLPIKDNSSSESIQSEKERRARYFSAVPKEVEDVMVPLIGSCLENLPFDRPTADKVCNQLETLESNSDHTLPDNLLQAQMMLHDAKCQLESQASIIREKESEIESLRSISQTAVSHQSSKKSNKSSIDFWKNLKLMWQQCTDLPGKLWTTSIAELDGKVYAVVYDNKGGWPYPFVYDVDKKKWSVLPELPSQHFSLVSVSSRKQLFAIGGVIMSDNIVEVTNKMFLWDEKYGKWLTPYPDMPTARHSSSCVSYGSAVIVAGGVSSLNPRTMTRAVEVLRFTDTGTQWSVVDQLPHVTHEAVPLTVNDHLYIAGGYDGGGTSTCSIVSASLPQLLQSNNNTSSGQVWNKLPDMPYCSFAINHYQGRLITFTGDHRVEQPDNDKSVLQLSPSVYLYNPDTKSWDYVDDTPHGYYLGKSVHINEDKILFVGGLTGVHDFNDDDILTTCTVLNITSQ